MVTISVTEALSRNTQWPYFCTGLASAACLARIGLRVTIAEIRGQDRWGHDREERGARVGVGGTAAGKKAKHKEPAALEKNGVSNTRDDAIDPGVGIWTHGLACLDELGILQQLEAEGRWDWPRFSSCRGASSALLPHVAVGVDHCSSVNLWPTSCP